MYYIYHIPERKKIGVAIDVVHRMKEHKWTGFYEILETHTCEFKVSDREQELQKEYKKKLGGYRVDTIPYHESLRRRRLITSEQARINGSKQSMEDRLAAQKKASIVGGKLKRRLTYQQAEYIRAQYKRGSDVFGKKITMYRLADVFGVSRVSIGNIIKNKTYTTP